MPQLECEACVRTRSVCVSVCVCVCVCRVCDLPWLQVSWLVRNDRLALSCTPHPPGPPHSSTQPTHLLWKHARSLDPSCVYAVWAFVCACARQSVQFCHRRSGRTSGGAEEISSHAFVASIYFFLFFFLLL